MSRGLHIVGISAIALAAFGTIVLGAQRKHAEAKESVARGAEADRGPRVIMSKVAPAPSTRVVVLQGDVRAYRQATVYAKVSGYLQSIRVDRGDNVKAGEVIGVIESPEAAQQERSVLADLTLREHTEERVRTLAARGVVSQQDLDNAVGSLDVARAERARVGALRGYEVLKAPFDGRVTARFVDQGALLSAATSATASAQEIVEIADTSRVRIFVYPGQVDAMRVHEGDAVAFWSDADPAKHRTDKVTRIAHALDARTRTMLAEIDVDNAEEALRPGSYVHVELTVPSAGAATVPADSIVLRSGASFVAVVKNGRAAYVPVTVLDDDGKVVRLSSGVSVGMDVIVHPSDDVIEGAPVQAAPPKS